MTQQNRENAKEGESISQVTLVAFVLLILLAIGALFWPDADSKPHPAVFLVMDPSAGITRNQQLYEPFLSVLSQVGNQDLRLEVVTSVADFQAQVGLGARYILCPDGVALGLPSSEYSALVTGRRAAPQNLRPKGAWIYRKPRGGQGQPKLGQDAKVIVGDSLSLLVCENMVDSTMVVDAVGPDPYDHSPVLHTLRLADFDYALVRHWDALRFFESGLLSHQEWGIEVLGEPWPDVVLLADRGLATSERLGIAQELTAIGRERGNENRAVALLLEGLKGVNLAGFNILLERDFEMVRNRAKENWPLKSN